MSNNEELHSVLFSDKILNYIITGLEFYIVMLNNAVFVLDMDIDMKNEQYADCYYTYHYLSSFSNSYRSKIRLQKPDKKYKENNILYFVNNKNKKII